MNNTPSTLVPATHKLKRILSTVLLLGALVFAFAPSVRAQITINFVFNGTDTSMSYNVAPGSLSSLTYGGTTSTSDEHHVGYGGLANVTSSTLDYYGNPGYTNPAWGSSPVVAPTSFSGDAIRFWENSSGARVPAGFDRATGTLVGTMLWTSLSLEDLGFASNFTNSGSFAALGTTVIWSTTNTAIPEPSTYVALFGLAALCFSAVRRRTQRT